MGGHGGSFRTRIGEVTVDSDAVRIKKQPRAHLRRQLARWHHGERWDRVRAALRFGLDLAIPPLLVFHLLETWETATAGVLVFVFVMTGFQLFSCGANSHARRKSPTRTSRASRSTQTSGNSQSGSTPAQPSALRTVPGSRRIGATKRCGPSRRVRPSGR